MKQLLILSAFLILLSTGNVYSQGIPEGAVAIDENTIIKDAEGNELEFTEFIKLMDSGEWILDPKVDKDGELLFLQLKKATEEDKKRGAGIREGGSSSDLLGKSAPDFEMTDINGNTISSETTKGKIVVLNFWFTACKPCVSEIPALNEVYEKYKDNNNVVFASITFNEEKDVNTFLEQHPIKYPVVAEAKEICELFKVSGYPTNIVIDHEGNYLDNISGGFPQIGEHISDSIERALKSKVK